MAAASALGSGLAVMPAQASETRVFDFAFACDGTNKTVDAVVSGFAPSVTRLIQGGEVILTVGRPRYILLRAAGDPKKQILGLGRGETSRRVVLTGFIPVTMDAGGSIHVTIDGACDGPTPGRAGHLLSPEIQGTATVQFF